ncbi:MAG: PEGA domain-containing protein [Candidatus Marinimicrobia bacterium]|nr:PEGA domain-containing protein [Candidatus Neomarinimicrobiota bacterium]MBL7022785.1 PEGA domain-containing protein [Candidatus Neomarinimicrobiota bacterium]MBL7109487.1 PEGA domain-containing protein [Candidatus Neomarinimicrobiota bacterium]
MINTLLRTCLILVMINTIFINAQDKIAVVQFAPSGVDETTASNITSRFSFELSRTKRFDIVEREMMNKIIDEQKFQKSGCVADECAVEIGQMIGVRQIVAGSISKIEDFYSLSIRLIDVESGEILYQDMDDYQGSVKDFIQITIKNMALRMAAEASGDDGATEQTDGTISSTKTGSVVFNINQNNVAIFIDGRYSSRSSGNIISLSLSEGQHSIKFSLSGFSDWEKGINVLADEQMSYDVELLSGITKTAEASTGILLVHSEPQNATVFVDGVEKGKTLLQITDIGVGEHTIKVVKNLYYDYTEIVKIQPDAISETRAELKPNFGNLSIKSNPTGAVVMINGQIKGKTPYQIDMLKSGSYNISISKDLYHSHDEKFIIVDRSENVRDISLIPAFGKLIVTTKPNGAKIKLDGQKKGVTPFELDELPSGSYHLTVSKELFQTIDKDIIIEDGQTEKLDFELEARSGLLNITGQPKGAIIYANGNKIGEIPLTNYRIAEGMVALKVESKDYHSKTEFIQVQRKQTYNQTFGLERHSGKLIVITEPPQADVVLDEKPKGKTPKILNGIPTGVHTIKVTHPEFLSQTQKFSLSLDEKKEFRFKLMTYEGSIQEDIDNSIKKRNRYFWSAITTVVIAGGLQLFSDYSLEQYPTADENTDSTYRNAQLGEVGAKAMLGVAGVLMIPTLKYTFDIGKLSKKLEK